MKLLVAPISGGAFPVQISMMRDLMSCHYTHDVYFCTSGGAISTFALVASGFNANGLNRIVRGLDERYIFKHWSYLPLVPSWFAGLSKGTIFNLSPYCISNLSSFITEGMIRSTESWIGTYSLAGHATLFCSKSKGNTIIEPDCFGYEVKYLDGNVELTTKATITSATIPMLIPNLQIDGKSYVDGGLRYSSPLTPLGDSIPDGPLHIDYLATADATKPVYDESCRFANLITKNIKTLQETTRTMSITDRQKAITLVTGNPNSEPDITGTCSKETLVHLLASRDSYYKTCIEFYPEYVQEVPLLDISGSKVKKLIEDISCNYQFRLWKS